MNKFRLSYRIAVGDGAVNVIHGLPPAGFLAAVADIVQLHRIDRGEIECLGVGRHARLRFTKGFPDRGRQAIRNAWTPPTTPGPGGGKRARG